MPEAGQLPVSERVQAALAPYLVGLGAAGIVGQQPLRRQS